MVPEADPTLARNAALRRQILAASAAARSILASERGALVADDLKAELSAALSADLSLVTIPPSPEALARAAVSNARLEAAATDIAQCIDDLTQGPDAFAAATRIHAIVQEAERDGVLPGPIVLTDPQGRRIEIPPVQAALIEELVGEEATVELSHGQRTSGVVVAASDDIAVQDVGRARYVVHPLGDLNHSIVLGESLSIQGGRIIAFDRGDDLEIGPRIDLAIAAEEAV